MTPRLLLDAPEWVEHLPTADSRARGPSRIDQLIGALKRRPGCWAIVAEYKANSPASSISDKFKRSGCEATCRAGTVYARWPEALAEVAP